MYASVNGCALVHYNNSYGKKWTVEENSFYADLMCMKCKAFSGMPSKEKYCARL